MTTETVAIQSEGSSGWYVALAQMPGTPVRLQLAILDAVRESVAEAPVSARRSHQWGHPVRGGRPVVDEDAEDTDEALTFVAEASGEALGQPAA